MAGHLSQKTSKLENTDECGHDSSPPEKTSADLTSQSAAEARKAPHSLSFDDVQLSSASSDDEAPDVTTLSSPASVKQNLEVMNQERFPDLSKLIASNWKRIAARLKPQPMPNYKVNLIEQSNRNPRDQASAFLNKWWESYYKDATAENMCCAMVGEDMIAAASKFFGDAMVYVVKGPSARQVSTLKSPESYKPSFGGVNTVMHGSEYMLQTLPKAPENFQRNEDLIIKFKNFKMKDLVFWIWGPPGCGKSEHGKHCLQTFQLNSPSSCLTYVDCLAEQWNWLDAKGYLSDHLKSCQKTSYHLLSLDNCDEILSCWKDGKDGFLTHLQKLAVSTKTVFAVLLTTSICPPQQSVSDFELKWLEKEEAESLLVSFLKGSLLENSQTLVQRFINRCYGVPQVLISVGHTIKTFYYKQDIKALENEFRRFLSSDRTLYATFCERFDSQRTLEKCYDRYFESLPKQTQSALLCVAVIPGTFSYHISRKVMGDQCGSLNDLLQSSSIKTLASTKAESDVRYEIPVYFRQYLQEKQVSASKHPKAVQNYREYLKATIRKISRKESEKMFLQNRRRIVDFLESPEASGQQKWDNLAIDICTSKFLRSMLLQHVPLSRLQAICRNGADLKNEARSCLSLFQAEVILNKDWFERGDLTKVGGLLKKSKKKKSREYQLILAEFYVAESGSNLETAVTMLKKLARPDDPKLSAMRLLSQAHFQIGMRQLFKASGSIQIKHFEDAVDCYSKAKEQFRRKQLLNMLVGDSYFRNRKYKEANDCFLDLREEVEKVSWVEGSENDRVEGSENDRDTCISAILYAQGLCQLLRDINLVQPMQVLQDCMATLIKAEHSMKRVADFDIHPFTFFVQLAKAKVMLLLNLVIESPIDDLSADFHKVESSSTFESVRAEAHAYLAIASTYSRNEEKLRIGVEASITDSAKPFLKEDGLTLKSAKDVGSDLKSSAEVIFGRSFLYLDVVSRNRNRILLDDGASESEAGSDDDISDNEQDYATRSSDDRRRFINSFHSISLTPNQTTHRGKFAERAGSDIMTRTAQGTSATTSNSCSREDQLGQDEKDENPPIAPSLNSVETQ